MQIWRTTRSSPGTSYIKARLVSLRCFVLTVLFQTSLASLSIWSICFALPTRFLFMNATATEWNVPQQRKYSFFQFPRSPRRGNQRDGGKEFTIAEGIVKVQVRIDLRKCAGDRILLQVVVIWLNAFTGLSHEAVEGQSLGYCTIVFASCDSVRVDMNANNFFLSDRGYHSRRALFYLGRILAMKIVLEHHQMPHKLII